ANGGWPVGYDSAPAPGGQLGGDTRPAHGDEPRCPRRPPSPREPEAPPVGGERAESVRGGQDQRLRFPPLLRWREGQAWRNLLSPHHDPGGGLESSDSSILWVCGLDVTV